MASSNFIVSAIKYRPNTFAEVLAQDHITRTLQHSLERGHIANAYLFSGPRGTGKTTTARILAKALNCENSQHGEPCNQCKTCHSIAHGNHPDVLEIDAASNTGVDNIRQLRENARFTPSMGRYKIYIIDECHMLSTQANNALLKTLEEPPEHCKFIFATTEIQKILPTILSRCQRYPFRRIPVQVIVEHLRDILSRQNEIEIADPAQLDRLLFLLARTSEGCLRDALFALDQLLAFCSGSLDLSEVEEIMGAIAFDQLDRYVRALIQQDLPTILDVIENLSIRGKEISLFLGECIQFLRNLAVIKVAPKNLALIDLPDEYRNQLIETASLTSLEQILYMTDQLWDTENRIRNSSMGRIIMEMASIKAAKAGQAVKIEDLLQKISSGGGPVIQISAPAMSTSSASSPAPQTTAETHKLTIIKSTTPKPTIPKEDSLPSVTVQTPEPLLDPLPEPPSEPRKDDSVQAESTPPIEAYEEISPATEDLTENLALESDPVSSDPPPQTSVQPIHPGDSLNTIWNHFLKELEEANPMLAGALENSAAVDISGDVLLVAIPSENMYSLRTVERPNNQEMLTQLIHQSFGKKLKLRCEPRDDLNRTHNTQNNSPAAQPAPSRQEMVEKVQQNKVFSKLMEEIPGHIVNIKPV